jgi:uncharacterized damage-inducible protein DinB
MNTITSVIAKHFKEVHYGGNWTWVNLKDTLVDVSWQQAATKLQDCNTIAALTYHINYYVAAIVKVLQGGPLDAHDKHSFDCPLVRDQQEWEQLQNKLWNDAETFLQLVESFPDEKLLEIFTLEKYGTYLRNFMGLIEHTHYHMGQIVMIKKMLQQQTA